MTEEEIRQAFAPYKHPHWQVVGVYPSGSEDKNTYTCDNYHMFNALYRRLLNSWGYDFNYQEDRSIDKFISLCAKIPDSGLYARFPSRMNDDISQDEIYGICTRPPRAKRVYRYGSTKRSFFNRNLYSYWLTNPNHFKWQYCYARYPSFLAYVKASAGKSIWFSQFLWCAGFLASAFTSHGETSGKLLSYLQIPVMERYFIPKQAIKLWKWVMMKRYPKGIKELYSIFFPNGHVFVTCAREDFE